MSDVRMDLSGPIASAAGLRPQDAAAARTLVRLWAEKKPRNDLRDRYYDCHVGLKDIGVAIPEKLARRIDPRIDWPRKAVRALADRSRFDGFASPDADTSDALAAICARNRMKLTYRKAVIDQLKHCCAFWEVVADPADPARALVSAYPATAAAALWDDSMKAIAAGLVVTRSEREAGTGARRVTEVRLHLPDAVVTISRTRRSGPAWEASYAENRMGRPLMEPMAHGVTLGRPFGRSRITRAAMATTDDAVREEARSEIAAEFAALPQKWLLGTDRQIIDGANAYSAAMGNINEVVLGPDAERAPTLWQSPQLSMQPHIDYMRALACRFAGQTEVPVSSLGVVSDNPSSAEAIYAAKEDLVIDAQDLNESNGEALRAVALMALAVERGTTYAEELAGAQVVPRFRNPAMPSVVSQSDAMVKQVQAIPWLADTEVALEELGYSEDQIVRMRSDRDRAQASQAVSDAIREAAAPAAESGGSGQAAAGPAPGAAS